MPSHLAAATNQPDCLHVLLSCGLCPPDERTSEAFTPLMLAATADTPATLAVLLRHGADLEARNAAGRTALFLAAVGGSASTLQQLVEAGAAVDAVEHSRCYTPLLAAVARGAVLEASRDPRASALVDCARALLSAGADVAAAAADGLTSMHAAAEAGSLQLLHLLQAHGAAVDATDAAGRTPLAGAAAGRSPNVPCVLYLLRQGAAVSSESLVRCALMP